jgi:hypothetical protein
MAKEELGDLSTATLEKRKTFATVILGILVGVTALNIIVAAVAKRSELFAVAAAMFAVGYPMYAGRQKVEAELQSRDDR